MSDLHRIESEIARLKSELAEYETAAKVLRILNKSSEPHVNLSANGHAISDPPSQPVATTELSEMTISQACRAVFADKGDSPIYYRRVAREAMQRGYRGKSTSTAKAIEQSFWAIMHRSPESFESLGNGHFRLKK